MDFIRFDSSYQSCFAEGLQFFRQNRLEDAAAAYEKALFFKPHSHVTHKNLGVVYRKLGKTDQALQSFRKALSLKPEDHETMNAVGILLYERGKLEEAEEILKKSLNTNAGRADTCFNLALIYQKKGLLDQTAEHCRKAVELNPDFSKAHHNLGAVCLHQGFLEEAEKCFCRALEIEPEYHKISYDQALLLLLKGHFAQGWEKFESRYHFPPPNKLGKLKPLWDGTPVETLLVTDEQGLGDTIQFVRYLPLIKERCKRLLFACPEKLRGIFQSFSCIDTFVNDIDGIAYDAGIGLLSLPRILHTDADSIPADIPYVHALPEKKDLWGNLLENTGKCRVGLVWAGNPRHYADWSRSLHLWDFAPLAEIPDIAFYSLQVGQRAEQAGNPPTGMEMLNHTGRLRDFSDTAALISHLDLVITVDTSVAHLTGAMGKSVWTLLPYTPDWRWMLHREDSPWYPTMRLFRKFHLEEDWKQVILRVADALREFAETGKSSASLPETGAQREQPELIDAQDAKESHIRHQLQLAMQCRKENSPAGAQQIYQTLFNENPEHAAVLYPFGIFCLQNRDFDRARHLFEKLSAAKPELPDAHLNLGIVLGFQGKYESAEEKIKHALSLKPDNAEGWVALGLVLQRQKKTDEALECYRKALALRQDHVEARIGCGNIFLEKKDFSNALHQYQQALECKPGHPEAGKGAGICLKELGRFDDALALYQQILDRGSEDTEFMINIANTHKAKGDIDQAVRIYRRSLEKFPDHARLHLYLGIALLLQGNFRQGWQEYVWRWNAPPLAAQKDKYAMTLWDGSALKGKSILLHTEQGLGDSIHFVRYIPMVKEKGGKILLECEKSLLGLFQQIPGIDEFIIKGNPLPRTDFHASLLDLPCIFKTEQQDIPSAVPYLAADGEKREKWKHRLRDIKEMKVGLVWAGSPVHTKDHLRSIPLHLLAPVLRVPGICFFSLQVGDRSAELKAHEFCKDVLDFSWELKDFTDTAALMSELDLIISTDSSPAHLAGALGLPVWNLLPFLPDWRWMMHREDSPWYPTMRLFRQTVHDQWEPVIEKIALELKHAEMKRRGVDLSMLKEVDDNPERGKKRTCKCCTAEAFWFGSADFSKCCEDRPGRKILPLSDKSADYFRCTDCGFLFTDFIDHWSVERLKKEIYNDAYLLTDPDFVQRRPAANAALIERFFSSHKKDISILDYGGGNGELAKRLQESGFADVVSFDPLYDKEPQKMERKFDVVLAFEVVEHMPDQRILFGDIGRYLKEDGIFIFSTLLQPDNIAEIGMNWWYAGPRNGHVSLHTQKSLENLTSAYGFQLVSFNQNLHMAFGRLPDFARHLWDYSKSDRGKSLSEVKQNAGQKNTEESILENIKEHKGKITGMRQCRHGMMLYVRSDMYVGRSLDLYGEFSEGETEIFRQLIRPGDIVIEAGSNIGAHTVYLAKAVGPGGCVLAYEPQRFLHQILCANIALNELMNVYARQAALGESPGKITVPVPDYAQTGNFGGISLGGQRGEMVAVETLDAVKLPRVRMIKADVEGMECQVLRGGIQTIRNHRPFLYVENDRKEKSAELIRLIGELGYRMWWHTPRLFNSANYAGRSENVFGNIVSVNLLCIPREFSSQIAGLREVTGPEDTFFSARA